MPNEEAIHLGLSSATLLSAGFMLCAASIQDTKRHHSLQLCVCSAFLPLTVALVILSALRLNWMSAGGAIVTAIKILVCLSLTIPPIFEVRTLWQLLNPWDRFYHFSRLPVLVLFILEIALAFSLISSHVNRGVAFKVLLLICSGGYILLLAGGISACHKCVDRKPMWKVILVETLSPFLILVFTCVLLILGWLHVYDESFTNILVEILVSMTTCSARFAVAQLLRSAKVRISRASARPKDDELELTHQEEGESREDRESQPPGTRTRPGTRPGTSPSTRHEDMSCKLSERDVEPEDSRILFEMFDKATSSDSIQCKYGGPTSQTLPVANISSQGINSRASSAEISQLQIPMKRLRKRLSSEALGGDESRQKVADLPAKKEIDMSDMLAEINGIKEDIEATKEARRKSEEQAKEDGKRVKKKTRKRKQRELQNPVLTEPDGKPPGWKEDHDGHLRQNAGLKQVFDLQLGLEEIGKMKAPIEWIKKRTEELGLQGPKGDR